MRRRDLERLYSDTREQDARERAAARLRRQEWWDHRREVVGTVLLYLCFLAYVPVCIAIALADLTPWLLATMLVPMYVAATIKGDV